MSQDCRGSEARDSGYGDLGEVAVVFLNMDSLNNGVRVYGRLPLWCVPRTLR